jgi:hypothetical protein
LYLTLPFGILKVALTTMGVLHVVVGMIENL